MAKARTGTIEAWVDKAGVRRWRAKITLGDKSRLYLKPPEGYDVHEAKMRTWVARQQETEDKLGFYLKDREDVARVMAAADGKAVSEETVAEWCGRYLTWFKATGGHSWDTREGLLRNHVYPVIGTKRIATLTRSDVEDMRDVIDARVRAGDFSWRTGEYLWSLMTTICKDAATSKERALRVREDNPAVGVKPPDTGRKKMAPYLYPKEALVLFACEAVPLRWRRLYAVTSYLYLRSAEVRALLWEDVDLEHARVRVHQTIDRRDGVVKDTKSLKGQRYVPIPATLLPLLETMKSEGAGPRVIMDIPLLSKSLPRSLRTWLTRAGLTRAALHQKTATTRPMNFHDLRATGITWCAARGDEPMKLMQRAGHEKFDTTLIYIREAENLGTNIGEVFPSLPSNLIELSTESSISSRFVNIPREKGLTDLHGSAGRYAPKGLFSRTTSGARVCVGWRNEGPKCPTLGQHRLSNSLAPRAVTVCEVYLGGALDDLETELVEVDQ